MHLQHLWELNQNATLWIWSCLGPTYWTVVSDIIWKVKKVLYELIISKDLSIAFVFLSLDCPSPAPGTPEKGCYNRFGREGFYKRG